MLKVRIYKNKTYLFWYLLFVISGVVIGYGLQWTKFKTKEAYFDETVELRNRQVATYESIKIWSDRYELPFSMAEAIRRTELRYSLPEGLLFAICWQESRFNPLAVGTVGEIGIAQIRLSTAQYFDKNITEMRLFDLYVNLDISGKFLNYLINRYRDLNIVTLCYNMGEPNFKRLLRNKQNPFMKNSYSYSVMNYRKQKLIPAVRLDDGEWSDL